ncbi:DUF6470 family protein [Paenibacillus kobensis]|uniref:DUF6470 family protein n=1 Tax=Paenibacillus kobensis TaxID=59841 RepID=UPI000FD8C842|nr:DUF6470 family protein [Paenibacillus kobensis]
MNDLRLSIRQTFAFIGMDSEPARLQIHSQPGDLQIEQPPAVMEFQSSKSELSADSSQAWHALGKGPNLEWSSSIYSQMKSVFLQNLAQQVEEGKRMANITISRSAFADLAQDALFRPNPVNYQVATPGYDNVRMSYTPGSVDTRMESTPVQINFTPRPVEFNPQLANLDIYLRQKNSINIEVTQYDLYK